MLNKVEILNPDAFILDLEDSVPFELKELARNNIKKKLETIDKNSKLNIFIRTNELCTDHFYKDIKETISTKIIGYVIPKFENTNMLEKAFKFISDKENEKGIQTGKIKFILMIENPKGILELGKINNFDQRILALAIGWEDFTREINVFTDVTDNLLDFVRMTVLIYAKANHLLAIDTVYKNFSDSQGLKSEAIKILKMGFNGKFAIHPNQIDILNSCFIPADEEIGKMEVILKNKDKFEQEGAININGVMYDPPHLKWALKLKEYLNEIERKDY
ncbi:MAG: CoA ester lyase [Actinobacteria bacterium]|nr:CoA ester lyase [Actinomycetota bacterium]